MSESWEWRAKTAVAALKRVQLTSRCFGKDVYTFDGHADAVDEARKALVELGEMRELGQAKAEDRFDRLNHAYSGLVQREIDLLNELQSAHVKLRLAWSSFQDIVLRLNATDQSDPVLIACNNIAVGAQVEIKRLLDAAEETRQVTSDD